MENTNNRKPAPYVIRNARPCFCNFEGRVNEFNKEGRKQFSLVIEGPEKAALQARGYEVKTHTVKKTGEIFDYITVKIGTRIPRLFIIEDGQRVQIDDVESALLDLGNYDIENITVSITPYECEVMGKHYQVAYAKTIVVTIAYDELMSEIRNEFTN